MAIAEEVILERPVSSVFAAGRVFYLANTIVYYSQTLEGSSIALLSQCYSKNDPTAEHVSDLLATDGGTIPINGATKGVSIKEVSGGVVVFCRNGVWSIGGPSTGFSATEFSVTQISSDGCVSAEAIVQVGDITYYWSEDKIHIIQKNEFGTLQVTSLIDESIETLYTSIPLAAKKRSNGFYNKNRSEIEWFYSALTEEAWPSLVNAHDRSIVLNLKTGGFFLHTFNGLTEELSLGGATGDMLVGGIDLSRIRDDSAAFIGASLSQSGLDTTYKITVGRRDDINFQDFGVNYPTAYVETGYETLAKPSNKKVAPYITTHFAKTEQNWVADGSGGFALDLQSGCQMRAKWDWNDSSTNGRWAPAQQVYRFRRTNIPSGAGAFDSGETVISTKNKMLGRGNALSVRFEQEAGKDMQLLGYTVQWSVKGRM